MLALLLGLQVASLLWYLGNNGLSLGEGLLWASFRFAAGWAAKFLGDLLTLSLRRVLLDGLLVCFTDLLGPLGTLLLGGVTLSDVLALLFLDGLTLNNVILNSMFVVPGLTLRLVDSPTFLWALAGTDERSVAEFNLLSGGNLLVIDEAALHKVLLALLLLLGLEVSGVGGVALLGVAMLALDDIIVLGLLNHHNLVDTPLAGSGNGSDVQGDIITASLTGSTGIDSLVSVVVGMVVVVVVGGVASVTASSLVKGEGSPQVLAGPVGTCSSGTAGKEGEEAQTFKSVHVVRSLQVMATRALLSTNCPH